MKKVCLLFVAILLTFSYFSYAQEFGLEEMLFRQIPTVAIGTLTEMDVRRAPVSSTIITSDMIEMAPVRNIYDLLEIYVPSCTYVTHYDSTHIGVRGSIVDRDYRSLLLLNGRVINQKAVNGMTTELENWDLNDIEKIEVIRGPGSVTYGPGAITSVVNIITKNASTSPGKKAGLVYVGGYHSAGGYASFGETLKDKAMAIYSYLSCRSTRGITKPDIYYMDPRIAASGQWVGNEGIYAKYDPADYYNDVENDPQIKFHTQIDFWEEYSFYLRYTNSGTSRIRSWTEYEDPYSERLHVGKYSVNGELLNGSETRNRQFYIGLENKRTFFDKYNLDSLISYDSIDGYRRQFDNNWTRILNGTASPDFKHPSNMAWNYSESHLGLKSTLNFELFGKHPLALGAEYSYETYGPGWGQDAEDAVIFDGSVIFCGNNPRALEYARAYGYTPFYGDSYYTKESGFHLYNYGFPLELNYKISDAASLLLSSRVDKNRFSRHLISPRAAAIYDAGKLGIYKAIIQRSVRMPTAVNLYLSGRAGNKANPEELKSFELNYLKNINNFDFFASLFRNQLKAIGWNSAEQKSAVQGRLRTWGTEFEIAYKTEKHTFGFNYAYTKMLDWETSEDTTASGISYHDYNQDWTLPTGMILTDTGDNLANWPNNMAKLYTINELTKKIKLFFDCRFFWGYEGSREWMEMWEKAAQGTSSEATVTDNIRRLRDSDIYDIDFRADLALKYQFNKKLSANIFVMNFLPLWSNYRYQYMQQSVVAIKEPTVFGFRVDVEY